MSNCVGTFVEIKHMAVEWCDIHKQQARACGLFDDNEALKSSLANIEAVSEGRLKTLNEKADEARREWVRAERAEAERDALASRIDATIVAALRYESRHDRDHERGKLWGELKMALMVDASTSPEKESGGEK